MFYGLSHVDVQVVSLERALLLYVDVVGFAERRRGDGWVDLDTGTVTLRLLETKRPEHGAALRVQVRDVEGAYRKLLDLDLGLSGLYSPMRTEHLELMASLQDESGNTLILWRELSEDEYGFDPELPMVMTWASDAEELMKSLLRSVPALFRGLARRKVVKNAEYLARDTNRVTKDEVVRAYILSNAKITRHRVKKPLLEHGYQLESFAEEFDA